MKLTEPRMIEPIPMARIVPMEGELDLSIPYCSDRTGRASALESSLIEKPHSQLRRIQRIACDVDPALDFLFPRPPAIAGIFALADRARATERVAADGGVPFFPQRMIRQI